MKKPVTSLVQHLTSIVTMFTEEIRIAGWLRSMGVGCGLEPTGIT